MPFNLNKDLMTLGEWHYSSEEVLNTYLIGEL